MSEASSEGMTFVSEGARELARKVELYEMREALFSRVSSRIGSAIDLDALLQGTVNELGKMMMVSRCDLLAYSAHRPLRINYEYRRDESVPSSLNLMIPGENRLLAEYMSRNRKPIVIEDTASASYPPVFRQISQKLQTRSILIVPIAFQDELLGILGLHHCEGPYRWSADEVAFVQSLAQQVGIAFQYAQLYREKEKEVTVARTLLEIATELSSKLGFEEISEFIVRKCVDLLKVDAAGFGILDRARGQLSLSTTKWGRGGRGVRFPRGPLDLASAPGLLEALASGKVLALEDPRRDPLAHFVLTRLLRGRVCLLASVLVEGEIFGVLALLWARSRPAIPPEEVQLLEGISSQMAITLENNRLSIEVARLRQELKGKRASERIIGTTDKIRKCLEMGLYVAGGPTTVLVQGESGTGKELLADLIHENSPRAGRPYVKINCGAIPETLLESELFGHERGAFTDAKARTRGKFEQADGGTLFLDEVGEMSAAAQVMLLRILQNGEFQRVGGSETLKVDVRVIAASNADLQVAAEEGRFRKDLFYRLNVYPITLPPLRERKEDIPLLLNHFLEIYKKKSGKYIVGVSEKALRLLRAYDWPGNVRELENAIERAVVVAAGRLITVEDLPEAVRKADERIRERTIDIEIGTPWRVIERKVVLETLNYTGGVKKRTAEILGIGRKTLYRKLQAEGKEK